MILGSAISLGEGLGFFGFLVTQLFFMNRIYNEEQLLTSTFGEQYMQYKSQVPQLVPGAKVRNTRPQK